MTTTKPNGTLGYLSGVAPKLFSSTCMAISAARDDRWSTRPAHVAFGGINFVVHTRLLPVHKAAFERLLDEEHRDGVRLRLQRQGGIRTANIDLAIRHTWSFTWLYNYTLASTPERDFCFVPKLDVGPLIEIRNGNLQLRNHGPADRERVLSAKLGEQFLPSMLRSR